MQIETRKVGEVLVVEMAGRLDSHTAGDAGDRLSAIARGPDKRVVLNLAGLTYVSSAGLRALLLCAKLLESHDGALRISDVQPQVLTVLETSGFNSLLSLHPSEREAIAAFAEG
jgi:anti-anti-sigma factor